MSSRTFHEGIPLARRPFNTVYSNESRDMARPVEPSDHRRSGAEGLTPPIASSPWQRKQYTWNHFHPW